MFNSRPLQKLFNKKKISKNYKHQIHLSNGKVSRTILYMVEDKNGQSLKFNYKLSFVFYIYILYLRVF